MNVQYFKQHFNTCLGLTCVVLFLWKTTLWEIKIKLILAQQEQAILISDSWYQGHINIAIGEDLLSSNLLEWWRCWYSRVTLKAFNKCRKLQWGLIQVAMQSFQLSTYRHPSVSHDLTLQPPQGNISASATVCHCFTTRALSVVLQCSRFYGMTTLQKEIHSSLNLCTRIKCSKYKVHAMPFSWYYHEASLLSSVP